MIEALLVTGGALGISLIGLFVLSRDARQWANRIYALLTLSFVVLIVANLFTFGQSTDPVVILLCIRLVAASTTAVLTLLYFLLKLLLDVKEAQTIGARAVNIYLLFASLGVILLNLSPLVFESVSLSEEGGLSVTIGWAVTLFGIHALIFLILSIRRLIGGLRQREKTRRGQSLSILIGLVPTLVLAPITSFVLPVLFNQVFFVAFTPLYIVFFVAAVAYAMIRHGLFDIRLAAVRTAAYGLTLLSLSAIYYGFVYVISVFIFKEQAQSTMFSVNPANIGLALVIAFIFQPIKRFFDKVTDKLFYKDNYSIDEFISKLNQTLNSTNDLRTLLERSSTVIGSTLKSDQAFFFVNLENGHYMTAGTDGHAKVSLKDVADIDPLGKNKEPVLASLLGVDNPVRRMMISHRIELIMPLFKSEQPVGYLCLGSHRAQGYTRRDIRALTTIADELIIAIKNALAVEEVRQLNLTLEQRIDTATRELRASNAQLQRLDEAKDEFISMASHQLRTPLTSIKGYVSMLIEGDMGAITKEQKQVLTEAFMSSERMVRLISDFLNVSRLQTGKFVIDKRPVDLAQLVQHEVNSLVSNAASRDQKFIYKAPKNIPKLEVDENKIQQVVMNFADNAIYYSKDGGVITVTLKKTLDGFVEFRVKDQGIGVPEKEKAQLFKKFFRATNARKARPDGTGVGLFLAKKVIDDHDGSIIFESTEGKGSTFGFRLPVPAKKR